jgi:hypothetical protein
LAKKNQKRSLSFDDFVAHGKKTIKVDIPEMDGVLYMKRPTTGDALEFASMTDQASQAEKSVALLARLVVNEEGERIFKDDDESTACDKVKSLPMKAFQRLSEALTSEVSSTTDEQEED